MTDFFENDVQYINSVYNPNHDLFDDPIQMNHIDKRLLELIVKLEARIRELEDYTDLHKIEVE